MKRKIQTHHSFVKPPHPIANHLRENYGLYLIFLVTGGVFIGLFVAIKASQIEPEKDPHYGQWYIPKGAILNYDSINYQIMVPVDTSGDLQADTEFLITEFIHSWNYSISRAKGVPFKESVLILGTEKQFMKCTYMEGNWIDKKNLFAAIPIYQIPRHY